jgi:hypothetical protein
MCFVMTPRNLWAWTPFHFKLDKVIWSTSAEKALQILSAPLYRSTFAEDRRPEINKQERLSEKHTCKFSSQSDQGSHTENGIHHSSIPEDNALCLSGLANKVVNNYHDQCVFVLRPQVRAMLLAWEPGFENYCSMAT